MVITHRQYAHSGSSLPLVSIIAICHNHAPYVIETLESIRLQTYPNIQLIIINNLKDECEGIIRNWISEYDIECVFIQNESALNISQNLNLGLNHVAGEYFQGISCDDVLLPYKLDVQIESFLKLPENCCCVYGDMEYFDEKSKPLNRPTKLQILKENYPDTPSLSTLKTELTLDYFVPAPTVLIKTCSILEVGGYNDTYSIEDWPLWVEFSKKNFLFFRVDMCLVNYRVLVNSLSNLKPISSYVTILKVIESNLDFFDPKNDRFVKRWQRMLIAYKRKGGRNISKRLLAYLKATRRFDLIFLLRIITPEKLRDFFIK